MRNEESIYQYCTRQRAVATLSLNAGLNKIYQELSYLLFVSGLLNMIECYIGKNKQKQKLKVITLPGYVLYFLTTLFFHISIQIFCNLFICFVFDGSFAINLFLNVLFQTFDYFLHVLTKLLISLC